VILTSSVYILFWVVLSLRLIWRHIAVTRVAVAVVCVAAVLGVSMLAKFNEEEPGRYGVLIGRVVTARAGPDDSSRELFELHDGAEVVIEEDSAGWYRIVLADGKRGWVEAEQLETL